MKPVPPKTSSSKSKLVVAALVVFAATVLSGFVSGSMNNRWGTSPEVARGVALLEGLPKQFGPWSFQGQVPLSDDAQDQLQCYNYENGGYLNTETGDVVHVSLIVGPYGPMSVHSPDICYPAQGFQPNAARRRARITPPGDKRAAGDFWVTSFEANKAGGLPMRVYYSWFAYGEWMAPDNARFGVGGDPAVFKLQVASDYYPAERMDEQQQPCVRFIKAFLPVWRAHQAAVASPPGAQPASSEAAGGA